MIVLILISSNQSINQLIDWLIDVYKRKGAETAQYGLEIIFKIVYLLVAARNFKIVLE